MKRTEILAQRAAIAATVAEELFALEACLDEALNRAARLTGRLATARIEAGLSAVVGQPAFERSTELVGLLGQVRGKAVEAHHALKEMHDSIGLRGVAWGGDKPEEPISASTKLRAVASAA
jgi:hypothetical protein